jgi:hypothetical protein
MTILLLLAIRTTIKSKSLLMRHLRSILELREEPLGRV